MSQDQNLYSRIRMNSNLKCKINGCVSNRNRVSGYCINHNNHQWNYGHAEHVPIKPSELDTEDCKELITLNYAAGHKGVILGVQFFDKWLQDAFDNRVGVVCPMHMGNLKFKGVTGIDLLSTASATWLYFNSSIPERKRTPKYLKHLLGHFVTYGKSGRVYGTVRRKIGTHIFNHIRVLLISITKGVEEKWSMDNENLKFQYQPLTWSEATQDFVR